MKKTLLNPMLMAALVSTVVSGSISTAGLFRGSAMMMPVMDGASMGSAGWGVLPPPPSVSPTPMQMMWAVPVTSGISASATGQSWTMPMHAGVPVQYFHVETQAPSSAAGTAQSAPMMLFRAMPLPMPISAAGGQNSSMRMQPSNDVIIWQQSAGTQTIGGVRMVPVPQSATDGATSAAWMQAASAGSAAPARPTIAQPSFAPAVLMNKLQQARTEAQGKMSGSTDATEKIRMQARMEVLNDILKMMQDSAQPRGMQLKTTTAQ